MNIPLVTPYNLSDIQPSLGPGLLAHNAIDFVLSYAILL